MLRRHDWTNSNASPQPWWQPILFPCQPNSGMMTTWDGEGAHEQFIPTAAPASQRQKIQAFATPVVTAARIGGEGGSPEQPGRGHGGGACPAPQGMPAPEAKKREPRATSATEQNSKRWFEEQPSSEPSSKCGGKRVRWNTVVRFRVIPAVQDIADKANVWWSGQDIKQFCCHERRRRLVASETGCAHDSKHTGLEVEEMVAFHQKKARARRDEQEGEAGEEEQGVLLPRRQLVAPPRLAQENESTSEESDDGGQATPPRSDSSSPSGTNGEVFQSPLGLLSPGLRSRGIKHGLAPPPTPSPPSASSTELLGDESSTALAARNEAGGLPKPPSLSWSVSSSPSSPPPIPCHARLQGSTLLQAVSPPPPPLVAVPLPSGLQAEVRVLTWPVNQASHLFHATPFVTLPTHTTATSSTDSALTAAAAAAPPPQLPREGANGDTAQSTPTGGGALLGSASLDRSEGAPKEASNNENHNPALVADDGSRSHQTSFQLGDLLSSARASALAVPKSGADTVLLLDAPVDFGFPGLPLDAVATPKSVCELLAESTNLRDMNRRYGQYRQTLQQQSIGVSCDATEATEEQCQQREQQQEDGESHAATEVRELHQLLTREGPPGPPVH